MGVRQERRLSRVNSRKRIGRKYPRRKFWLERRNAAFLRAKGFCEVSGNPLGKVTASRGRSGPNELKFRYAVDHIVPERMVRSLFPGADPHILDNLIVISPALHSRKTAIEYLIFKADFLGYKRELNRLGFDPKVFDRAWKALCESQQKRKAEKQFLKLTKGAA